MSTHHALQTSPMPTLLDALRELLGERLSTSRTECEQHGRGESYHQTLPPDAVCYAESTAEVATIVKLCAAQRVPIIAFGAGTSLEGHVGAAIGGVCIDLSRMQRIIDVRPDDLDVGTSVPDMLAADLRLEYKVRAALCKGIELCEQHSDFVTREILRVQLNDTEEDHTYWLEKQLGLIKLIGLENYLQSKF